MFKNSLGSFKNKLVDIRANGFDYRGICLEITDEYIFLRRVTGYSQINMDRIQSIRLAGEKVAPLQTVPPDHFKPVDGSPDEVIDGTPEEKK